MSKRWLPIPALAVPSRAAVAARAEEDAFVARLEAFLADRAGGGR